VWIPDGEKVSGYDYLFGQYTNVTFSRLDGQTDTARRHRPRS